MDGKDNLIFFKLTHGKPETLQPLSRSYSRPARSLDATGEWPNQEGHESEPSRLHDPDIEAKSAFIPGIDIYLRSS
jgi:hypothetical protein